MVAVVGVLERPPQLPQEHLLPRKRNPVPGQSEMTGVKGTLELLWPFLGVHLLLGRLVPGQRQSRMIPAVWILELLLPCLQEPLLPGQERSVFAQQAWRYF